MTSHYSTSKGLHLNYELISDIIPHNSRVLDLGCGSGELMKLLVDKKSAKTIGVDINQANIISAIEKGLSVIQGDIDAGLKEFADNSYDFVVLNQTLQSTHNPEFVLQEMLRVGKRCVVSFPNFAYWRVRSFLFFNGKMPKSNILPFEWYDTPNIHLLTINDFFDFARKRDIKILHKIYTTRAKVKKYLPVSFFPNLLAEEVIFVISKF
ncbi:MAG: methionine biosynthesis protein MetW [Candidatus Gastranaerophilales bacterium]|nr:methionine biosynthesis protein MetW [Candidatus Gastranaerophilales bacterium]